MRFRTSAVAGIVATVVAVAVVALNGGCGRKTAPTASAPTPVVGLEHRFVINVSGLATQLRLAIHDSERARGLMEVTAMPEAEGMLFVWAKPQAMSFYMRNTKLPLDIGFFDAGGVLREIYPMYPGVEDSIQSRADNLQFALEMNHGWYARHQVIPGASIDLTAVRDALKRRGYNPEKFFPGK